jgi:hypothetical protein
MVGGQHGERAVLQQGELWGGDRDEGRNRRKEQDRRHEE